MCMEKKYMNTRIDVCIYVCIGIRMDMCIDVCRHAQRREVQSRNVQRQACALRIEDMCSDLCIDICIEVSMNMQRCSEMLTAVHFFGNYELS